MWNLPERGDGTRSVPMYWQMDSYPLHHQKSCSSTFILDFEPKGALGPCKFQSCRWSTLALVVLVLGLNSMSTAQGDAPLLRGQQVEGPGVLRLLNFNGYNKDPYLPKNSQTS